MDLITHLAGHRFYQNVRRLLRCWRRKPEPSRPLIPDDAIQFTSVLTLDAPRQEVASLQLPDEKQAHYRLAVQHFGLLGTFGALPLRYTEWLFERRYRYGDESPQAFLDIFNHRLLSLLYQAWQKSRPYVDVEISGRQPLSTVLQALTGQLTSVGSAPITPAYAGLITAPVRSLANLQHLLRREFATPVTLEPFRGRWHPMPPAWCCRLGSKAWTLGSGPMLGQAYWDLQSAFHIRLGPVSGPQRQAFMPGGRQHQRLTQRVKEYVGGLLSFSLELCVTHPATGNRLNGKQQLGWDLRLGTGKTDSLHTVYLLGNRNTGK